MNSSLFFILTALILGVSLYIGKKSAASIKNQDDFFLSSRGLGLFKISMTILATQLGGGAIIGTAEAAYNYGWFAISYSLGIATGLIILALGIGAKFRTMEVGTVPEIFDKKYNSKILRKFSSILYITSMFLILVAIGVSARKFSSAIGVKSNITFIVFWLIIIAYTTSGGLTAVTKTDILQVIFILISFVITFVFLLNSDIVANNHVSRSINSQNIPWLNWLFFPCLFAIIGQDMAQRCFAAKSPKDISRATVSAAILLIIASLLPTYLGVIAYKIGISNIGNSSILIKIVNQLTNPYIASIFACSILMAILSTADSLLCAISSNVALDFFPVARGGGMKATKLSKAITVVIGLSAMGLSFFTENIIPIMVMAYEISASALFVPIIMTVIKKKTPKKRSAYLSSISGIVTFAILNFASSMRYEAIIAVLISLLIFLVSEIF